MLKLVPIVLLATFHAGLMPGAAQAGEVSAWVRDLHSALRLRGAPQTGAAILAGIEIELNRGWKTYWRTPGDSGVPPRFDFSASDNVARVDVLWPAPVKFEDGAGGHSLGYRTGVILPLEIIATDPMQPVILRATINYAVCEKLCVPVDAKAELRLPGANGAPDTALARARADVPVAAKLNDLQLPSVRRVQLDGTKRVLVDIAAAESGDVDLFVEGPTPDWALPQPDLVARRDGGIRRFGFDLEGLPDGASAKGAVLKLTVVGDGRAIEVDAILD